MNIAIIIASLEKYGGAERVAIECVQRWQMRHSITLYATGINHALLREHGVGDSVACRELTAPFAGEHAMLLNAVLLPKIWREEIGRHDIYFAHSWPTHLVDLHPMVWYPNEPARALHDLRFDLGMEMAGDSVVRSVHFYPKYNYDHLGHTPYEAYVTAIDAMDKSVWPERVVSNSRYTARYLEGVSGRRVPDIVYPGVDVDDFIELPADPNLFVTIGQLWPHKRIGVLIEAISLTDEAQLVVIGAGPERGRLLALAAALGVQDRVFFMSGLTNRELHLILARACAFLFAAIKEPFGIVVLEAMAAGLAVIAADEGGYVEICNENSAFLLRPFPSAFAEKISYLQRNPDVAKAMGRAGKLIAPRYTWKQTADSLEAILTSVADEWAAHSPPRPRASDARTQIGVQYFLWYGNGYGAAHWNDNRHSGAVQDRPLLGYYNSPRGQTIEHHLDLFESMGLDFAILNLHIDEAGPNALELIAIRHVFEVAARRNSPLRFAVQIALYGASAEAVRSLVQAIQSSFAGRDNYFMRDQRPVLFWFWSGALDGDAVFVGACKQAAGAFSNLAASLRMPAGVDEAKLTFGVFDGMAPFSPLELSSPQQWEQVWQAAYEASERANLPLRIATISPGYDDRALDDGRRLGNPHREVPRNSGETYKRSMAFVEGLQSAPDLVVISTFNELHENSHIEPTLSHGNLYVDLTRAFVERLNKRAPNP